MAHDNSVTHENLNKTYGRGPWKKGQGNMPGVVTPRTDCFLKGRGERTEP